MEYPAFGTGANASMTLLDFGVKVVSIRRVDDLDSQSQDILDPRAVVGKTT